MGGVLGLSAKSRRQGGAAERTRRHAASTGQLVACCTLEIRRQRCQVGRFERSAQRARRDAARKAHAGGAPTCTPYLKNSGSRCSITSGLLRCSPLECEGWWPTAICAGQRRIGRTLGTQSVVLQARGGCSTQQRRRGGAAQPAAAAERPRQDIQSGTTAAPTFHSAVEALRRCSNSSSCSCHDCSAMPPGVGGYRVEQHEARGWAGACFEADGSSVDGGQASLRAPPPSPAGIPARRTRAVYPGLVAVPLDEGGGVQHRGC